MSTMLQGMRAVKWDPLAGKALAFDPIVESVEVTATLAQINAGLNLVAPVAGRTLRPVSILMVVTGTFLTLTDVRLSDTAGAPVDIVTVAVANLTAASRFGDLAATGLTFGAGFGADLTIGQGIQIRKTGAAGTGGTSIFVRVLYKITTAGFQAGFGS